MTQELLPRSPCNRVFPYSVLFGTVLWGGVCLDHPTFTRCLSFMTLRYPHIHSYDQSGIAGNPAMHARGVSLVNSVAPRPAIWLSFFGSGELM